MRLRYTISYVLLKKTFLNIYIHTEKTDFLNYFLFLFGYLKCSLCASLIFLSKALKKEKILEKKLDVGAADVCV